MEEEDNVKKMSHDYQVPLVTLVCNRVVCSRDPLTISRVAVVIKAIVIKGISVVVLQVEVVCTTISLIALTTPTNTATSMVVPPKPKLLRC